MPARPSPRPEPAEPEIRGRSPERECPLVRFRAARITDVDLAQAAAEQQRPQPVPEPCSLCVIGVLTRDANALYARVQQLIQHVLVQDVAVRLEREPRLAAEAFDSSFQNLEQQLLLEQRFAAAQD